MNTTHETETNRETNIAHLDEHNNQRREVNGTGIVYIKRQHYFIVLLWSLIA